MLTKNGLKTLRFAGRAIVMDVEGETANASATHDVIVSGTVTSSTNDDSLPLVTNKTIEFATGKR